MRKDGPKRVFLGGGGGKRNEYSTRGGEQPRGGGKKSLGVGEQNLADKRLTL